ncbi:MAG: hypothetical protein U5L76_05805 [Patescibacteria group bacterium]|nr:hypothetical protein [Patescibacteria group bacterium]
MNKFYEQKKLFITICILVIIGLGIFLYCYFYYRGNNEKIVNIIEFSEKYKNIKNIQVIDGKLIFQARNQDNNSIIYFDGREYGANYSNTGNFIYNVIGDDITYIAYNYDEESQGATYLNGTSYVIHGEKVIYMDNKDYYIDPHSPLIDLNEKIAFQVYNRETTRSPERVVHKDIVIYNGQEYGLKYDSAFSPFVIDNKLGYQAKNNGKVFLVVNGQEYGLKYDSASSPFEFKNKLGYQAKNNGKVFLVVNGQEYGLKYDSASSPFEFKNKLGYIATNDKKQFLVINGKIVTEEYDNISCVKIINNKLAYAGHNKIDNYWNSFFVYDNEKIETNISTHTEAKKVDSRIFEVNKKPVFVSGDEFNPSIFYNNKEWKPNHRKSHEDFTKEYYEIKSIGGKLAFEINYYRHPFLTMDSNTSLGSLVYYNGKEYGTEYDEANSPFEVAGQLGYVARNDNKDFLVINGKIYSPEYLHIKFAQEINGKLVYIAKENSSDIYYTIYKIRVK